MTDFFTYDRDSLLKHARFPLTVFINETEVFTAIADDMVRTIHQNNEQNEKTVVIVPVGPVGQYPFFIEAINRYQVSLKDTYFINMDGYLPINHRLSFRGFMEREVYQKIDSMLVMDESHRIFPDPKDPEVVDALIPDLGEIDV